MTLLERAHASAGMGHFVLDPKRKAIEFSSWVRDHIGLNDMPIPLDRFPEIVVEEEREEFSRKIREVVDRKQDFSFEINIVTANGEVRTQRISGITAFENEHTRDGLIGYFGILQEITHEKRSNEELRKARDSAQAQLEARTNLLAVVSHEIRTPLSGILGVIDQLKRERSPAERERALAVIEDSSEVLLDTLDAILQQARIGGDTANLERTRFLPISIALRVAELFRPLARRKGLRIEVAGPSGVYALGDPTRLQQVIANFVSNAVKFTQSGIVSITVREPFDEANEWVFTISDTGSGMDDSRLAGIFDPFGTSKSDSLGRSVGAGLGLSITRDLVEVMGGRIRVESEPGCGSTFAVFIPFGLAGSAQDIDPASETLGKVAILVGRATYRVQVEATVSTLGYEIAEQSESFVAHAKTNEPLILIVDAEEIGAVPSEELLVFDRIIALISESNPGGVLNGLGDTPTVPIETIPKNRLSRSLTELLGAIRDDAA